MKPNKRDLKAYVRYDGSGRIIPGSNILSRKQPKVGNWVETSAYECCTPSQSRGTSPLTICVSGFIDNPGFSGTYTYVGLTGGKPHYEKDGNLYDVYWGNGQWNIGHVAISEQDVDSPDLVTIWLSESGEIYVVAGICPIVL